MSNIPMMQMPVPQITELDLDRYMATGRPAVDLLARRQLLKQEIEDHEAEVTVIDLELGSAFDLKGIKNAVWEDYIVIRRQASKARAILDRVLLMDAGVTPQQLEAGTKFSAPGKPGITVQHASKAGTARYEEHPAE